VRAKVKKLVKKGMSVLKDEEYVPAQVMSDKLGIPVTAVFRLIRYLRVEGIGVLTTPKGYILSEFAKKNDDVHFLRRLNGRRASDFIAIRAAEPDIRKRWNSVEDKRNLRLITAPLHVDLKAITDGAKILLSAKNGKGL
jgi:biotin operon repressor